MKDKFKVTLLPICIFLLSVVTESGALTDEGCSSQQCHSGIIRKEYIHAPAKEGECLSCHENLKSNHPSGEGAEFKPTEEGAALCFQCHDQDDFQGKFEHGPSAFGACILCHNPHSSDVSKLLRKGMPGLCAQCHSDFFQELGKATYVHSAISELTCVTCHAPHSSERKRLLKAETTELCFDCHDEMEAKFRRSLSKHKALYVDQKCANCHLVHFSEHPALLIKDSFDLCLDCHGQEDDSSTASLRNIRQEIEKKEVLHGPLAEGDCSPCHDPHGSSHSLLLKGPYPESFYSPFKAEAYDLCFQCHDKELLTDQKTANQTDFRNGTVNLHYLHVVKERKGRTCRACHSVHASDGKKLINSDGIPFGGWQIPIRYAATETGGSCVPGCHQQMSYDREEPVDNKEMNEAEQ